MSASAEFVRLFSDRSPFLRAQLSLSSDAVSTKVKVCHRLGAAPSRASLAVLKSIRCDALKELCDFYLEHDGLDFCRTYDARYREQRPLLKFVPASQFETFTNRYKGNGDRAWTMDLNKSNSIYRGSSRWIAFVEVDSGPACLTIFTDGENAGRIFFATPQPWFNILRPIAKDFEALLDRIARDPIAFFRLVGAMVSVLGADGQNYGFKPVEYACEA